VTLHLQHLLVLGIASSTLHWLAARSEIARPLWSRAAGWFDKLLRCPACSGFWLGLLLSAAGVAPFEGLGWAGDVVATAVASTWLTPVFEALLLWGLTHSAVVDEDELVDHDEAKFAQVRAMIEQLAAVTGRGAPPPPVEPEN
jgi:hypothetical protein